jgi:hypothetical protein
MNPDADETLEAILAHAGSIRLEDVEADLDAAMSDPLLQDIVDRALAEQTGLTAEQRAEAREALLLYFAADPRTARLLEEVRSGGGKSHVVDARISDAVTMGETPRRNRGAR